MPVFARRRGTAGHFRDHRLSDECASRRSVDEAPVVAGRHGHHVWNVRGQNTGVGEGCDRGAAIGRSVAGGLRSATGTHPERRQRRNRLSGRRGLFTRGNAYAQTTTAHPAYQRQAVGTVAHPTNGRGTVRGGAVASSGIRRSPHLHRRAGCRDGLPDPPFARVLRAECGRHRLHSYIGHHRRCSAPRSGDKLCCTLFRRRERGRNYDRRKLREGSLGWRTHASRSTDRGCRRAVGPLRSSSG